MSGLKSIAELRKYTLCDKGERLTAYINADKIADEIEREHAQQVAELHGFINARDLRIDAYERRNTELNDALKAICKRFGVSTEWCAEDAAKKVLEALERDYIALPKDADGVPIRVGDKLEGVFETFEVCAVSEDLVYWAEGRHWNGASECRHVRERTLRTSSPSSARRYAKAVRTRTSGTFASAPTRYAPCSGRRADVRLRLRHRRRGRGAHLAGEQRQHTGHRA